MFCHKHKCSFGFKLKWEPSLLCPVHVLLILTISLFLSHSHAQNLTSKRLAKLAFSNSVPFDPLVTAKCEKNLMQINVLTERPFNGIVHVRGFRRSPCQTLGYGNETLTTLNIDIFAEPSSPNYCGVFKAKGSEERSVSLVIRLHKALELSDDKNFVITCGNTDFVNNKKRPQKLTLKFYDQNGHKLSRLYHGESYRLRVEVLSSQAGSMGNETSPHISTKYHLFIKNCVIFNANDSDIELLDANGCATILGVQPFKQLEDNIAEAQITSMFKLPETNRINLQCLVELIENCRFCADSLCNKNNGTRKERLLEQIDMSMLASTTAYVFEPDQLLSASILSSPKANNKECSEWRFPWLIALCIMLAVLLVIMMVINIFLCSSMSCSCFKPDTHDEPTMIEDYDPYKIDYGFYDSRLSLNRPYSLGPSLSHMPNQLHVDGLPAHPHSPASTTRTTQPHSMFN